MGGLLETRLDLVCGASKDGGLRLASRYLDRHPRYAHASCLGDTVSTHTLLHQDLELSVLQPTRVGPTQTRIVPIKIAQKKPIYNRLLNYSLKLRSDDGRVVSFNGATNIRIRMPWTDPNVQSSGIKASYFFGTSIPTAFLVGPPKKPSPGASYPPILALRAFRHSFSVP